MNISAPIVGGQSLRSLKLFSKSTYEIFQLFKCPVSMGSEPQGQVGSLFPSLFSGPGLGSPNQSGCFFHPEREIRRIRRPEGVSQQGGGTSPQHRLILKKRTFCNNTFLLDQPTIPSFFLYLASSLYQ